MSWWDNLKSTLPNVNAGSDPAAMGLVPIYGPNIKDPNSPEGMDAQFSQGAQIGWGKDLPGRQVVQYDMSGKETYRGDKGSGLFGNMSPAQIFALTGSAMVGGGLAANAGLFGSLGGTGGMATDLTAMASGTGGATGLGAAGAGAAGSTIASAAAPLAAGTGAAGASGWMLPAAIAGSSLLGAYSANKAASTQADAQTQANQLLYQQYQQQRADLQPFVTAGAGAQNQLLTYLGLPGGTQGAGFGKYAGDFGVNDMVTDPGYAFRFTEGQKALDRSAAARGGLISGGALKAATRYGQDMGSQEYQNAYNRYQTNRSNQLAPLFSLTGSGQASAAGQAAAAGNYGTQGAAGLTNIGAANAAGTVGATNALTAGLGSYLNYSSNQDMMNALTRRSAYGVT